MSLRRELMVAPLLHSVLPLMVVVGVVMAPQGVMVRMVVVVVDIPRELHRAMVKVLV